MDAEELVLWRHRRTQHGSAWRKPVGRVGETRVTGQEKATSEGRLEGIKDGPGLMREHQGVPGPNHTRSGLNEL